MYWRHDENRPMYPCPECQKNFTSRKHLKRHAVIHENDRKKFTCHMCKRNLVITSNRELARHMKLHSESNQEKCTICGKLIRKGYMRKHLQAHNKNRPMFSCSECQKTFKRKKELIRHSVIHEKYRKKYSCPTCKQNLATKSGLAEHLKRHSKDNKIKCIICEKLLTKDQMKYHLQTHNENRPLISCSKCPKTFKVKKNLKRHIANVHTADQVKKSYFLWNQVLVE